MAAAGTTLYLLMIKAWRRDHCHRLAVNRLPVTFPWPVIRHRAGFDGWRHAHDRHDPFCRRIGKPTGPRKCMKPDALPSTLGFAFGKRFTLPILLNDRPLHGLRSAAETGGLPRFGQRFVLAVSERWREDDSEHEHQSDSSGESGGEKEKLAYTTLAASLAIRFGLEAAASGAWRGRRRLRGAVDQPSVRQAPRATGAGPARAETHCASRLPRGYRPQS